ncbi:MAG: hypothetical protein H7125_11345 [Proteobacteria bacterium]|nr:hypothetical protein [Burkholderiales bacterium]
MWKTLRIVILLFILATVAQATWLAKRDATDWKNPVIVVLYPINADASETAARYIASGDLDRFRPITEFMQAQARGHGVSLNDPIELRLAPGIVALPPPIPSNASAPEVIWWSLRLRLWAWRNDTYQGARANVRLFLLHHDDRLTPRLAHSTGLESGLIGIVNVFANPAMSGANNVVIAHELLHTLGATDKYDLATNQPLFPDGYAEPDLVPRLPQRIGEIMAGRIPLSPVRAEQPDSLAQMAIGPKTAREIKWVAP